MTCEECGSPKATQHGEGHEMVILCDECWDSFQPSEEEMNELRQIVLNEAHSMNIDTEIVLANNGDTACLQCVVGDQTVFLRVERANMMLVQDGKSMPLSREDFLSEYPADDEALERLRVVVEGRAN